MFRPLGRTIARALEPTPVTPNQLSAASATLGVIASVLIGLGGGYSAFGGLVLFGTLALDCADGELARFRGGGGWRGRMVDGVADIVTALALHHGIVFHLAFSGLTVWGHEPSPWFWYVMLLLAGVSFTWNSGVLDALKQQLDPSSLDDRLDDFREDVHTIWDRFLYRLLRSYVARLRKHRAGCSESTQFRFDWIRWVGPTAHQLWMVVAAVAAVFSPYAFVVYLVVTLIPANLFLVCVRLAHRNSAERSYEANC